MTLETLLCIILLTIALTGYIILKATGEMWHGINWKYIWKHIRSIFR